MKEKMDPGSINALSEYRLERAKETLMEAKTLIDNSFFNAAVNRLYYACYYAVIALLVKQGIAARTHAGVKQMFGLHFVVEKKVSPRLGRFYNQLFNDRITGDYDDFVRYDRDMAEEILPLAEEFISVVKTLINTKEKG
ncbi:HEPN domain-containing protein [Marinilabilia rubra]|uniref:Antitoxin n=1 Tax=Marinilabilia rubra TaxID=2162893 RepID=A0A2U2B4K8_9BACT|nr:HEPN domain-containing protein [Marinilabilia rubra]PWD97995.1 antitoxin [Marinilabilia rubra]